MTEDQIQDQEVELHDEVTDEVVEEAHDPKNAEAQSVAATDKAGEATGTAPKRKGDQTKQDPMPTLKTKAAMMGAAVNAMQGMSKEKLKGVLGTVMAGTDPEAFEGEAIAEQETIEYKADFSDDLNALISEEATLSDEFKSKAETIFEAAIKSKLSEEIDRLEAKYHEELNEEIESTKSDLVEKVDNYLNYVVEQWMDDNKLAVQTGLRTEIAEKFMNNLKDLFTESYIEVPESKVDLVDDLADQVAELEESLNSTTASAIQMAEELEAYKREAIIQEASRDLADTQVEKLKSLVSDIDFDNEETFAQKVATVKESYFTKTTKTVTESADFESDDEDDTVEVSGSMAQYLSALNRTSKK
jgi:hypothetical protein